MILLMSLFSILVTFIVLKVCYKFLFNKIKQIPNERSSHIKTTPSAGGIAFVTSISLTFSLSGEYKIFSIIPIAIIGFFDDLFNLSQALRFLTQSLTSLSLIILNPNIIFLFSETFALDPLLISFLLVIFFTYIINAINFLDGLDGFITLPFVIFFIISGFIISKIYFAVALSLIVFLFWNWNPAKVFMGDVGSTFLGALLCLTISKAHDFPQFLLFFSLWIPYLLDSVITILMRFFSKENIFQSHSKHLYQKLYKKGLPHSVVTIIFSITSIFCFYFVSKSINNFIPMTIIVFFLGVILSLSSKKYSFK